MDFRSVSKDDGPKHIDRPPYERHQQLPDANLANFIQNWAHYRDRIALFLGAGTSVGARNKFGRPLPTAYHLRNSLWKNFMAPKPEEFKPEDLTLVSLEHAAALIERCSGRDALIRQLCDEFEVEAPLWQHAVTPYIRPASVFTTNYDTMIEQGWDLHSGTEKLGPLRVYYRDENEDSHKHIPCYKPHGTTSRAKEPVGHGGLVITQFDYIEMLSYRRKALYKCLSGLADTCVVFIGYSFQDLDIATALHEMRNPTSNRQIPWYAVFPRDDENVRGMYSDRYGIRQINRTFFDFMIDLDEAVGFIPDQWKFTRIEAIEGIVKPEITSCTVAAQSKP